MNSECKPGVLVSLQNVSVYAANKSHRLVDSVSCDVVAGEVLSIIGPNGAGKSTLLKSIVGDIKFEGQLQFNGFADKPRLRARQLAVLPQTSILGFPYRVSEVVGLARIPHATGYQRDQEIISEALALMDISYLAERLYTDLSGGEKQRVQLARVLAQIWSADDLETDRRLLILDEPTAALDLGHQHDLMNAVRQFSSQGVGVVMVMHDLNLAARYSDKLLAMLCSQPIAYGEPNDVITKPNVERLFNTTVDIMTHPKRQFPIVVGI